MAAIICPEKAVRNKNFTLRNIPEERRSRLHRSLCVKSRTQYFQLITFSTAYRLTAVFHSGGPVVCVNCNKTVLYGQKAKMLSNSRQDDPIS
jgi:hypothetical protein